MAVTFNPFVSKYGFKSDGFEVDSSGNITAGNLDAQNVTISNDIVADSIDVATIKLNGSVLFGSGTGTGTFQLENDFIVSEGSTPYLSIINGQISITNRSDSTGTIDNVDIGITIPAIGIFTDLTSTNTTSTNITSTNGNFTTLTTVDLQSNTDLSLSADSSIIFNINGSSEGIIDSNGINVPVVNTTINNTTIGATVASTGAFTSLTVANQPTLASSVTRKDYVDNQISAFAIAFGI